MGIAGIPIQAVQELLGIYDHWSVQWVPYVKVNKLSSQPLSLQAGRHPIK